MNEFKFQFVNILLLAALVFGMYWAFTNINNGITYGERDLVTTSETNVSDQLVDKEIFDTPVVVDNIDYEVDSQVTKKLSAEEKVLKEKLENLIADNINMKQGSRGTRVETVQDFLNRYFDTDNTVDGDYGPGTLTNVKKFQELEGLGADGLAGKNTYQKMIEILES